MSANVHHNNYKILYAEALEQTAQLKRMYQDEKVRADLLQADIDDLVALSESELARSVRSNSIN